jgi:hypothetical protein
LAEPTKPPLTGADDFDTRLAERMAAQIDGTLADGVSFLDGLADDDLAVFAEAAAIERELEEEDRAAGIIPLHRRPASAPKPARWRDVRVLAVAALVASVAVGTSLWTSGGRGVREASQAVALLDRRDLPAGYDADRPQMTATRSGNNGLSEQQRSAQVGVYLVDLELAIRGGPAEARARLAGRAATLMEPHSGLAVSGFAALGTSTERDTTVLLAELRSLGEAATEFLDADRVALGAWAEAARFAAADRDATFVRASATAATLDRAETLLAEDAAARAALVRIRQALQPESPDWASLRQAVDAFIQAIA